MSDTSLVFALSTRNHTADGLRDARQTIQRESEDMAADVGQSGAGAAARFGEALKAGAAGAMLAVGAIVAAGFAEALDQSRLSSKLAAQLDLTKEEAARAGGVAGDLYADAYGDSFETVNTAVGSVMSSIEGMSEASADELKGATAEALNFAETFDIDVARAVQSAGTAINAGLAADATEAFDLITAASSKVPAHLREDVLDASDEYGQFFDTLGFGGEQAFAVLVDASKKGTFGIDKAGDAIKEFTIRATDMSTSSQDAFKTIGLDAHEMANAILQGGDSANDATQEIIDGLLGIKDPADQAAAAIALFGTPIEDLNVEDIPEFLESLKGASGSMDDFEGAAKRAGDTLRDNAGTRVEAFKRSLQQGVVDFLGGTVIPAVDDFKDHFTRVFGGLWDEAGKGGEEGVDRVLRFVQLLGERLAEKAQELVPKAIDALMGVGQKVADFIVANPEQVLKVGVIAGALVAALAALPALVVGALASAAVLMVTGFMKKMVTALREKLPEWWTELTAWAAEKALEAPAVFDAVGDAIGEWFSGLWDEYIAEPVDRQWDSFLDTVHGLPGRAGSALNPLGGKLASASSDAWQRFQNAAASKAGDFIAWAGRLPGRISSRIGSLKNLLYSKGRDVVFGLWNGISSLGGWLWSKVSSFVSSNIVSAAASFLHIGSPSKLMADEIGHWIPPGIAEGAEGNRGVLDDTMRGLVDPALVAPPGRPPIAGIAPLAGAQAGGVVTVRIDFGDGDLNRILRKNTRVNGRGNVQVMYGQS